MAQATFHFPGGFLWGTATSSHQMEGNNQNNNWSAWEAEPGRIAGGDSAGAACDWLGGRWREDFDRAAEAGQNAHRLSIEWSRVQPEPDRWDEAALDRYRDMLRGLQERRISPMVTLHHFSDPLWLSEMGGWENDAVAGYFEAYTRRVVEALREYANLWVTINEPNVMAVFGFLEGIWPPGKRDYGAFTRVVTNQVRAHAAAYKAIHDLQSKTSVGLALNIRPLIPARSWNPLDRLVCNIQSRLFNDLYAQAARTGKLRFLISSRKVREAANTQDFLGINYYTRDHVAFNLLRTGDFFSRHFFPDEADLSETGMLANDPQGLFAAIRWGSKFKLPMYITENGVDDSTDRLRPRYLIQHLHHIWRAVNFNNPVKGYFHWSLVDNFEWERGWTQRFGLWELDRETQARRKRPSASLYAEICRQNSLSSEMVARYAPEIFKEMFPN